MSHEQETAPGPSFRPINPSNGQALAAVSISSEAEVNAAILAARIASRSWSALSVLERGEILQRAVADLGTPENLESIARSITEQMGKPLAAARAEVRSVAPRLQGLIDAAAAAARDEVSHEAGIDITVQWRPVGVVGVIGPWNYPISTPSTLVLSALLTGNGVVLKPSELTPGSSAHYHRVLCAHLPTGLFGIVQGGGAVGAALVAGATQMIAFTGSIATGQRIMREAANSMKRLVLELGGKDPMIVMEGADLEAAASFAARESLRNSGQVCISVERVFVPRSLQDSFVARVVEHARALKVGDPDDPATDLGPMASEAQRALVLAQLSQAKAAGAQVALEGVALGPGFWLTPTVLYHVTDDMDVATQETFGPVVAVSAYDHLDEAVTRANATTYGLGASVWGPEGEALRAVGDRMEAGMIGLNRGLSAVAGAPWVGWKMSGLGHTRSVSGMRQFLQPRSLSAPRPMGDRK